jgi:hypothetical protein|tara:strand:+ start:8457 stop:8624 length:168 start_codon:yes stop_codon:yes gene_type:complete
MAETLGWPVGHLKEMMSSREFTLWAAEFTLREEEAEDADMRARVAAGGQPGGSGR